MNLHDITISRRLFQLKLSWIKRKCWDADEAEEVSFFEASCRSHKKTVWGSPSDTLASAARDTARTPAQIESKSDNQIKSIRQLGLGMNLDFNEFLQRQTHHLLVHFLHRRTNLYFLQSRAFDWMLVAESLMEP